jgi:hypothetical protein
MVGLARVTAILSERTRIVQVLCQKFMLKHIEERDDHLNGYDDGETKTRS